MPIALIIIGLVAILTGVNNTYRQAATQLQKDGTDFLKWIVVIIILGAMGYVKDLQTFSRAFLTLILVAMVLSNSRTGKGLIGNFFGAIDQGPETIQGQASADLPSLNINLLGGSVKDTLSNAASGNNPGAQAIGSITAPWANSVRGFFGFSPIEGTAP